MHYSFSVNWAYLRFVFHLIVACGGEVDIRPAIILCTYCQRCKLINQLAEMVITGKLYWTSCTWRCCRSDSLSPSAASGNHMCQHWLWENKGCLDRLEKDIATFDNCSLWLLAQPTGHPPRGSMLPTETWGKRGVISTQKQVRKETSHLLLQLSPGACHIQTYRLSETEQSCSTVISKLKNKEDTWIPEFTGPASGAFIVNMCSKLIWTSAMPRHAQS